MGKKDKKKDGKKNTEVKVKDNTPSNDLNVHLDAKTALEALTDEQQAELLKSMGFSKRKAREKKDTGPDPRELFRVAAEKLGSQAPQICNLLSEFPGPVAVTFQCDPDGVFSANVKRVRTKYGPRKDKD